MTDREMLIKLLAIKIFEHNPLGSGEPHRLSWTEADPEDRQNTRELVLRAITAEDLYKDE